MYRVTKKSTEQRAAMRASRDRTRMSKPAPDYPPVLPDLRRRIVIENFDFGHEIHVMDFYKTNRIDLFRVVVDGKLWKARIGFSNALAGLRKSMPRVSAE